MSFAAPRSRWPAPLIVPSLAILAMLLAACAPPSPAERYQHWLGDGHQAAVEEYRGYLHAHGAAGFVPMRQLLRSGRRWRVCGAPEFALPPKPAWPDTVRTLRLIGELRRAGLLAGAEINSGYRDEALNRCEGGSSRSRHMSGGAYDFDLAVDAPTRELCAFWRRRGGATGFGLGFYDRRHLHIDAGGFRTWGEDFSRKTSLCRLTATARPG
ncbi:D-Ala-D-Ala carboxypeptidase family metallohydrolase [Lysobacter sp. CA196]|uniref:D-Ala-D-Ala carboxypeptidase family metallohydrolase n=1 Tax=Lysobacter sp. CA196 TaxID=3455606 RepID=UPI003F8D3D26